MPAMGVTVDGEPVPKSWVYSHRECSLRDVLGCYGQLVGEGHSHDVPYREDARRVEQWLARHSSEV